MGVFVDRLEKAGLVEVEQVLGIEHPARVALVEADSRVEARVAELDKEMFTPMTADTCVELGRRLGRGELSAKTVRDRTASAATKINPNGTSRRGWVLQGLREALVDAEDKPSWSSRALREVFVDVAQREVDDHVSALLAAFDDAPASVRDPLRNGLGIGFNFSKLSAVDLSEEEFAAYKRLRDLAVGESGPNLLLLPELVPVADAFAGRDYRQRHDSFNRLKPGMEPDFIEGLLWTDDAEILGAGWSLDGVVKGRVDAELSPIVDPAGKDRDVYENRVARFEAVRSWRFELAESRQLRAPLSGDRQHELRRREDLEPDEVLAGYYAEKGGN